MYAGEVTCATSGGQLSQMTLTTHDLLQSNAMDKATGTLESKFYKQLSLHRYIEYLYSPNF